MALPRRFILVLTLLASYGAVASGADVVVGSLKEVRGGVTVRRGGQAMVAKEGAHLQLEDIVETAGDGRSGLILQDGTRISLGPNAELKIDKFIYEPVEEKFGLLLRLARGVMMYVSGKIAQFSPESVRIETPVAVVGHRGTTVAISLEGM